jgi:DNA-binding NtrC family response regulator
LRQLEAHDWPGNVREIENLVEKIVNFNEGERIADVSSLLGSASVAQTGGASAGHLGAPVSLKEAERIAIQAALEACGFNVTSCAKLLQVSKPALYAKMKRHGIRIERSIRQAIQDPKQEPDFF